MADGTKVSLWHSTFVRFSIAFERYFIKWLWPQPFMMMWALGLVIRMEKILMVYHGLFSICIIPSGEKDCVPLCKLFVIVRHGADILLSIVVAFDSLVFLGPRVSSGNECDRFRLRAPSVSPSSTVQRFRLAQRPLRSIRSVSCVFSNPIICSRAFL